jgi:hypothetical protein
MKGRRIPVPPNSEFPILDRPGDYCGPIMGWTGDKPAVFFLKPNARDSGAPKRARSVQHVVSPPHAFKEEPDGTLTITASISDLAGAGSESDGWHGYLTKGEWRK